MPVRDVSPQEALALMQEEGYTYLDVRTVPEFDAGHPAGAVNVPLVHAGALGPLPNPSFLPVLQKAFAKDARLILGCRSGHRSAQAAAILRGAGFTNLVHQAHGFEGGRDPVRGPLPGWRPAGLPVETRADKDRTWEGLLGLL